MTPKHLWLVGIVSLLWNAMGVFDYSATHFRIDSYMSQFTPQQLELFYNFPPWMVAAWATGVWGALLGSLALLMRKKWAVWLFGASLLGLAGSTFYNHVATDNAQTMNGGDVAFAAAIWVIALLLFFYARLMAKRGVLH